jgi:hypothetical protein
MKLRQVGYLGAVVVLTAVLCSVLQAGTRPTGNETPGSISCVIFSPIRFELADAGEDYTQTSLEDENYTVTWAVNTTLNDAPNATMHQLVMACGFRFWSSHSNTDRIRAEAYQTSGARNDAWDAYVALGWNGTTEMYKGTYSYGNPQVTYYGIGILDTGIANHAKVDDESNDTVTFGAGCYSYGLQGAFGGREYFGYNDKADDSKNSHDAGVLWDYMTGIKDSGNSRPAGAAYAAGTPHAANSADKFMSSAVHCLGELQHHSSADGKTTLSPVVKDHGPKDSVQEGDTGFVEFDTKMNSGYTTGVVEIFGGASLSNFTWNTAKDVLSFDINSVEDAATYTLVVHFDKACSHANNNCLNGNRLPEGTDGVRPNQDVFQWTVEGDAWAGDPSFLQHDKRNPAAVRQAREVRP